jgi:hypothetical protein
LNPEPSRLKIGMLYQLSYQIIPVFGSAKIQSEQL